MPTARPLATALVIALAAGLASPDGMAAKKKPAQKKAATPPACADFYAEANKGWLAANPMPSSGAISARAMNRCLSIGVSVSVGLAMLRVVTGIPVAYILLPGYVLALGLSFVVPPIFVGIAFDSGGVASGPMTTTFLLPLSIGACETLGGNVMTDAFGVVALVALTPLIAVQLMGVAYRIKMSRVEKRVVPAFDGRDEIVELEEEWA